MNLAGLTYIRNVVVHFCKHPMVIFLIVYIFPCSAKVIDKGCLISSLTSSGNSVGARLEMDMVRYHSLISSERWEQMILTP